MQNPGRWVVACEPCPRVPQCCPICYDTAWASGQQRLGDTDVLCPEQERQVHHADLCHSDFLSPLLCPRQQGPCDSQGFQAKGPSQASGIHCPVGLAASLPTFQPRALLVQPGLLGRNVNPQRMEQPLTALVTCLTGLGWQLDMCGRLTGFQSQLSRSHAGSFLRIAKGSGVSFYRNVGSVLCLCFLPHPSL